MSAVTDPVQHVASAVQHEMLIVTLENNEGVTTKLKPHHDCGNVSSLQCHQPGMVSY